MQAGGLPIKSHRAEPRVIDALSTSGNGLGVELEKDEMKNVRGYFEPMAGIITFSSAE